MRSPHASATAVLDTVARDIEAAASSVFYSLAFLSHTHGAILEAVEAITENDAFVYGISDRKIGGLSLHKPNGSIASSIRPRFVSASCSPSRPVRRPVDWSERRH
ncbi:MAG TPA: hypothetical protein VFS02_10530 [Telluria sp.]|nr:hypothetical protein [Telluria sp.]